MSPLGSFDLEILDVKDIGKRHPFLSELNSSLQNTLRLRHQLFVTLDYRAVGCLHNGLRCRCALSPTLTVYCPPDDMPTQIEDVSGIVDEHELESNFYPR